MKPVTYSAARRRYMRKNPHQTICKSSQREMSFLGGTAHYQLVENNTIKAYGELSAVEAWCREDGVLHDLETIAEDIPRASIGDSSRA